jgi:pimeloyl-ACP methyl ester carboxylesterase
MAEEFIDGADGALCASHTEGDGDPVLFVHSDAGVLHQWDQIRDHLDGRTTAAFDRRGHGRSIMPEGGKFDLDASAEDIEAVSQALWPNRRFVLVGHSGGALAAFAYSAAHPDRLLGLVLVDPPGDPSVYPPGMLDKTLEALKGDGYAKTIEDYYRGIAGDNHAVVREVVRDAAHTPRETVVGTFQAMSRFDPRAYAGKFTGPKLTIIQPQFDIDGAIHKIDHGFKKQAIGGAGHWIHLAAPERFAQCLDAFLENIHGDKPARGAGVGGEARPG